MTAFCRYLICSTSLTIIVCSLTRQFFCWHNTQCAGLVDYISTGPVDILSHLCLNITITQSFSHVASLVLGLPNNLNHQDFLEIVTINTVNCYKNHSGACSAVIFLFDENNVS